MINIGVLGSTNGTDLQAVVDAIDSKIINASIKIVISNRENYFILKKTINQVIFELSVCVPLIQISKYYKFFL